VTELALRYIAAAIVIGLLRGMITEYLFLRLRHKATEVRHDLSGPYRTRRPPCGGRSGG
jgi:hypothetical protein